MCEGLKEYLEIENKLQECYRMIRENELNFAASEITREEFYRVALGEAGLYKHKELLESARENALAVN